MKIQVWLVEITYEQTDCAAKFDVIVYVVHHYVTPLKSFLVTFCIFLSKP